MLSTNAPSGIQRRRTQHRRQISTPAAFEAPKVRQLPATVQQKRQQRSGMSLDLRGLNLESALPVPMPGPDNAFSGSTVAESLVQGESTVSITNSLGQSSQHTMQVAQTHSQPQPGPLDPLEASPVQTSLPSPRTPHRTIRAQSPQQPPLSPSKPPTEQQLKDLREHIQSVYGSCGQVFINILPTPIATPQKPVQLPSHECLDAASLQPNFSDIASINLEPTSSAMAFDVENPDGDMGYDSSSYYTSDALSPSPIASPQQRTVQAFLEGIDETAEDMIFSQPPSLFPTSSTALLMGRRTSVNPMPGPMLLPDLEVDASLEYTGISPEEVQRYISEQDPTTSKWTCLYPGCAKVFGRKENIRSHVQTHLGDRQFKCNGCGKCFVRQHDLKRHAKIHTGNKPYRCPCSAGFARQDALTRHRQRGMCIGGFADAVRRQAKRGRPKKNRPDMDHRVEKANRTRRALASVASSVSASSPASEMCSPLPLEDFLQTESGPRLEPDASGFDHRMDASVESFSFDTVSSQYVDNHADSFSSSDQYQGDAASMALLQQLSQTTHTPPMSPVDDRPLSSESVHDAKVAFASSTRKGSSTPSRSSVQSNPFTTPPTSPVAPPDELDDLFNTLPEDPCSQFELEMKAMGEFSSMDTSAYDFLDFTV